MKKLMVLLVLVSTQSLFALGHAAEARPTEVKPESYKAEDCPLKRNAKKLALLSNTNPTDKVAASAPVINAEARTRKTQ